MDGVELGFAYLEGTVTALVGPPVSVRDDGSVTYPDDPESPGVERGLMALAATIPRVPLAAWRSNHPEGKRLDVACSGRPRYGRRPMRSRNRVWSGVSSPTSPDGPSPKIPISATFGASGWMSSHM